MYGVYDRRKEIPMKNKTLCRTISFIVCVCLCVSSVPIVSFATEHSSFSENELSESSGVANAEAGAAAGTKTVNDVIAQSKFTWAQGHGFAAEQGNNLIDKIKGKNASIVGDNNAKNGADRKIINRENGSITWIQDKYYSSASDSIGACFDDTTGMFKYLDADGNVMQVEVPSDQYEAAVQAMQKRIRDGKVPGVTDPSEAEKIVRRGNLTFKQAKNLAKAGTIESLTYDAVHGVVSASCAFGISTVLNYAICVMNGDDPKEAIKESALEGVKSGVGAFGTAVIAGQLSKTGIMNVFKPSSEALTKALGKDFSEALLKAYGQKVIAAEGESVAQSATKQAAQLLRSEVLVAAVTTIVFSAPDAIDLFRGRISKKQFVKNFAITAVSVVAGTVGYGVGGLVGNLVVPGVGTIPGGVVGSILLGTGGGLLADKIADYITDDDADEMYVIVQNTFAQYCEDYLITEDEANNIVDEFSDMLTKDMFKDMYKSDDREAFIAKKMEPLFTAEVAKREKIEAPTEEELRSSLKKEMAGVVFIH